MVAVATVVSVGAVAAEAAGERATALELESMVDAAEGKAVSANPRIGANGANAPALNSPSHAHASSSSNAQEAVDISNSGKGWPAFQRTARHLELHLRLKAEFKEIFRNQKKPNMI
eukprot:NODE_3618_length_933_cov_85.370968_g3466_i0.p3 GENE.NODE_3618_length_933_cov_85.370968_g3466_i0~~NODE_3618_length_933_cov_85.370968_g3466_i0.p3  ORF type:complete len:116 (+),score=7.02 NODE_3618_length_933_cov_85.370968_g3466_i0:515-862(+)